MNPSSQPGAYRRVLLIVNPGARRAARAGRYAVHEFASEGVSCDVAFTTAPGHATELVRERGLQADAVFTLGGDGTAIEAITALAERPNGPPIGILPGGTGNVLVRSLGIPLRVSRAVHTLLHGRERRIDLGRLSDGRRFAIGIGVGFDAAMIAGASQALKRRIGVLAYVWSAVKAGIQLEQFTTRLTVDGQTYDRRAASVLIANLGSVLGGLIQFGEPSPPDDGLLQACVYSPTNLWDVLRIFARMLRGTAHQDRCTLCVSGRHFRLETIPPRRAEADGELLGMTPLEISVQSGAARVLVPRLEQR